MLPVPPELQVVENCSYGGGREARIAEMGTD